MTAGKTGAERLAGRQVVTEPVSLATPLGDEFAAEFLHGVTRWGIDSQREGLIAELYVHYGRDPGAGKSSLKRA